MTAVGSNVSLPDGWPLGNLPSTSTDSQYTALSHWLLEGPVVTSTVTSFSYQDAPWLGEPFTTVCQKRAMHPLLGTQKQPQISGQAQT